MQILEIIDKKREGKTLSREELEFSFLGYLDGSIKDYQMSSLLMAITINGLTFEETYDLTDIMIHSGVTIGENQIEGIRVDKHSTGGVGDKVSLVLGPILASLGLKIGKLSGRGLGITGGTIDKLESIPGFNVHLTKEEFIESVNRVGFAECMQTNEFTPLDGEIYALRSATGTVYSIPLIASSIMSKKLAIGADYILIDVKVGNGALLKTKDDAIILSNLMIKIGEKYGKKVIPVLTDMSKPLGDNIGNALEVLEVIDVLKGKKGEVRDIVINLASIILVEALKIDSEEASRRVCECIDSGKAYTKFIEFVSNQGGNLNIRTSKYVKEIRSNREGIIKSISAEKIGYLSLELGAGRKNKEDKVDTEVGIVLNKHIGDKVNIGDILCTLYQNDTKSYEKEALNAFDIM